ncbi:MAG: hypothetical protein ABL888_15375, partial [Pirellulaceae bacterium]
AKPLAFSWLMVALSTIPASSTSWAQPLEKRQIVGAVIEQKKYSIRVTTTDGVFDVHLPSTTPVEQQLERPQFDWENRVLKMELLASARDGDPHGNLYVDVPLPEDLYLEGSFAHRAEFTRLWNDKRKMLVRYRVTRSPRDSQSPAADSLTVQGKILEAKEGDQVAIELGGEKTWIRLGDRAATFDGFSIQDLKSHETDVDLEAHLIDNRWVAQTVKFRRTLDSRRFDRPGLPRLLSLGDEVSVGWHRSLCSNLSESFNCHHPPEIADGSDAWKRIGCWLGDYRSPGRSWDVIVFNVVPAEDDSSREKYQANLERWVQGFQQTKARVIWVPAVTSNKTESSRYEEANRWAREFLGSVPGVEILAVAPVEGDEKLHLQIAASLKTALAQPAQKSNAAK